jgi:uncharacterized protein
LEELEREVKKLNPSSSLTDCFDFFAGTSTGSFIACGLAQGMRPYQIREFYEKKGEKIFPKMDFGFFVMEFLRRLTKGRLSLPLFKPSGLEEVLRSPDVFPDDLLFGKLGKPTLVVSYDTYNRKAMVFKSTSPKYAQIPIWQVCRSSSAAPVAFPAYLLNNQTFLEIYGQPCEPIEGDLPKEIPPEGLPLIDGGILANNPALCAIAEIAQDTPLDNIRVISFGTGQPEGRITPHQATSWGALVWADLLKGIPLYQVCSDGSADMIDYIAQVLLKDNYMRYQPVIDSKISTFQAEQGNLDLLKNAADDYLKNGGSDRIKILANTLINS